MKTTKILFVLLSAFILTACFDDPGTDIVWGDDAYLELDRAGQPNPTINQIFTRINDGENIEWNVQVNLMGRPQKEDVSVTFEIGTASTAIEGFHYEKITPGNTVTIPAGENTANIQFEIFDDNIEAGESWPLIITITDGDLPLSNYLSATFRLQISCPSSLGGTGLTGSPAGTYSYTLTNAMRGSASGVGSPFAACNGVTGTGTITESATSNGVYTFSDVSFGQFACAWGDTPPGGTVRLNDICDNLFFTGTDKYGDSYSLEIVSVTASTLTFDWVNTYGDGGRAALTRTDGQTWPLTLNTD